MTDEIVSLSLNRESNPFDFSFKDYIQYEKNVQRWNDTNSPTRFFNESDIHAAIVVNELIKRAIKYNQSIDMFCGSFYLFRDVFQERVKWEKNKLMKGVEEEDKKDFASFDPFGKLIESLKEFFKKNLEMNVVLEKEGAFEAVKKDSNWHNIFEIRRWEKSLRFYQLDSNLRNIHDHFIVSGNSFRKEISESNRTALCSFNRPEYAIMYKNTFELMRNLSQEC